MMQEVTNQCSKEVALKTMKLIATTTMHFDVSENDSLFESSAAQTRLADSVCQEIRSRLFGQGFLPDDITIDLYTVDAVWEVA